MSKIYIYAVVILALIGLAFAAIAYDKWRQETAYRAGYDAATSDYEKKANAALRAIASAADAQKRKDAELLKKSAQRLEKLRGQYDILKTQAVTTNICSPDFVGLYNSSLR